MSKKLEQVTEMKTRLDKNTLQQIKAFMDKPAQQRKSRIKLIELLSETFNLSLKDAGLCWHGWQTSTL